MLIKYVKIGVFGEYVKNNGVFDGCFGVFDGFKHVLVIKIISHIIIHDLENEQYYWFVVFCVVKYWCFDDFD